MKVFLCWSGKRSRETAEALSEWLPLMIQAIEPWISSYMEKGRRSESEMASVLEESKVGIICLTEENLSEDWILFEAGALSKSKDSNVCTFLLDLTPSDVRQPLAQFQATQSNKEDVRKLIRTINQAVKEMDEPSLTEKRLDSLFNILWPHLEEKLQEIIALGPIIEKKEKRIEYDKMTNEEAISKFVRDLSLGGRSRHTKRSYRLTIEKALRFLGKNFSEVDKDDLESYLFFLQEKDYSPTTIHRHAYALKAFFRFFGSDLGGRIRLPPLKQKSPVVLDMEEIKKLLNSVKRMRDMAVIHLLFAPGLTVSELINLNTDSIRRNEVRVESGKRRGEKFFLHDGTLKLILRYLEKRKDSNLSLFVSKKGRRFSERYIQKMIQDNAAEAGISKRVTAKTMKRSFSYHFSRNPEEISTSINNSAERFITQS